ncbi:hypothetical protein D3C80_857920 [compost metagenome]
MLQPLRVQRGPLVRPLEIVDQGADGDGRHPGVRIGAQFPAAGPVHIAAVDEDAVGAANRLDVPPRLAVHKHHVGALADLDRAAVRQHAHGARAVRRSRQQHLSRAQAGLHQQLHLPQRRDAVRRARHAGVGAQGDQDARLMQPADIVEGELELAHLLAHPRAVHVLRRGAARLDRLIDRQRRRIGHAVRLHQTDGVGVDLAVLKAVHDDVDAGAGRLGAAVDRHRVRHDPKAALAGRLDQGAQDLLVHAGVVRRDAIAPAVGERLDQIGRIGGHGLHAGARARRGVDPPRRVLIRPVGAMTPRRAHARRQVDVGRHEVRQPPPPRLERLGRLVEIVHRGDAGPHIGLSDGGRGSGRPARRPMGMQVEEAGQKRPAPGLDDHGARGRAQAGADLGDAALPDQDVAAVGRGPGRVEDHRVHDEQGRLGGLGAPSAQSDDGRDDRGGKTDAAGANAGVCHGFSPFHVARFSSVQPQGPVASLRSGRPASSLVIAPPRTANRPFTTTWRTPTAGSSGLR